MTGTGTVTGNNDNVGGLVGLNNGRSISNSYVARAVTGNNHVGGLVGLNNGRSISNSYATGDVRGRENNVGGLVGSGSGNISNSYATGSVTGNNQVGGFIGENKGNISDSYARGNVSGTGSIGGFIGFNNGSSGNIAIKNSYARGNVSGTGSSIGGFAGRLSGEDNIEISDAYWDKQRSGQTTSAGGTSKTTIELQSANIGEGIYRNWSTANWYSGSNGDYPLIRYAEIDEENPLCGVTGQPTCGDFLGSSVILALEALTISKVGESTNLLQNFDFGVSAYTLKVLPDVNRLKFMPESLTDGVTIKVKGTEVPASSSTIVELFQDKSSPSKDEISITVEADDSIATYNVTIYQVGLCDTTDIDIDDDGLIEICWTEGLNAIRHQLDGRGYKINMDEDAPIIMDGCNYNNTGRCRGYELERDLVDLIGKFNSWSPIGNNTTPFAAIFNGNGYTISNLRINRPNDEYIGLFGYTARNSTITNIGLLDINDKIAGQQYVGSLVGKNEGIIGNSYASSDAGIEETESNRTNINIGGLVGENVGTIINSYSALPVMGTRDNVGGLVGKNSGTIKNSYATDNVTGRNRVGGLVGHLVGNGTVENSYAVGPVSGTNTGGLVGFADNNNNNITASYWDIQRSNQTTSAGGTSKTTIELQSTEIGEGIYSDWSRDDWFAGLSRDYPILRYAKIDEANPACGVNGQPTCGSFLDKQNILALKTLVISKTDESRNLLRADFAPDITTHTVVITPDITTLNLTLEPFDSGLTIKVNDLEIVTTQTQIELMPGTSEISITVEMGDLMRTYAIEVYQVGLCDTENIDRDNDGLIEICWIEGLDAIRYQLDGSNYKVSSEANALTISDGCDYNSTGRCRGYELEKDLDFSESTYSNWIPIGNSNTPFTAIFNGNNHTISNLKIDAPTVHHIGLFGKTENSTIIAIGLLNVDISGATSVGSLAGINEGTISNSYATGTVKGLHTVGGLVGFNRGNIFNSYAKADISGNLSGGFVGRQESRDDTVPSIENSYADSMLISDNNQIGGFIGLLASGIIKNTYTTSLIDSDRRHVGGFVATPNGGTIFNSYAAFNVTGGEQVHGFAGPLSGPHLNDRVENEILHSYWDSQKSGIETNARGGSSKTTVELKTTQIGNGIYANWSKDDWYSGTDYDYPILKYTQGNDAENPLCGSDERPCTVLEGPIPPTKHFNVTKRYRNTKL